MSHKKPPAQTNPRKTSEKPPTNAPVWVISASSTHTDIRLKVVPGSRKSEIVGMHGDRLKIKVASPPEDGKANAAVCALLAQALHLHDRDVTIITGPTNAEKTARIAGACDVRGLA